MTKPDPAPRLAWRVGAAVFLFALLVLAYAPALDGGRLWDDDAHLTPPDLQTWSGLGRVWFEPGATQQYYPVLYSAFWLEHRLWGDAMPAYHLINVLWHGIASLLVVAIVRQLLRPEGAQHAVEPSRERDNRLAAWLAGAIFALHPVAVESVAWVSEQKNTLSAVFALAAALVWLRRDASAADGSARPSSGAITYALGTALFLLALFTKTVTAVLPAALLVIAWWKRGRLSWRRDVAPLLPWLVVGAAAGLFTSWVERTYVGAAGVGFGLGPIDRGLLAARALIFYAGKLLWPADLVFVYPRWRIDASDGWLWLGLAAVAALFATLVFRARTDRSPLAAALLFAGVLFPALGFVDVFPFLYSYVADHFQYLARLGLIVPASVLVVRGASRAGRPGRVAGAFVGAGLLVALTTLSWRQSRMYRDAETLYRTTLARNPNASMAHNNLGELLESRGARSEAREHFEAAVRTDPRNAPAHSNLGRVLATTPDGLQEGIREYETALRLDPKLAEAHSNLGLALARTPGREPDALAQLAEAVRLKPEAAALHDNLGATLLSAGRAEQAIPELRAAVQLDPNNALYHGHLAVALAGTADGTAEALQHFEAACRLDPDNAAAHSNLGALLAQMPGRAADALAEFQSAVRLDPGLVDAQYAIGVLLLETSGDHRTARAQFERVLQLDPANPRALQALQQIDRALSGK